jgi:hypothetical protein
MTSPDITSMPGSDEPMDDLDVAILRDIADLFAAIDPVPDGLVDRVQFALALEDIDAEVSRMREELSVAARGEEQSRTITFDSDSLTIMVTVSPAPGDAVRLDGWLAPPGEHRVELRTSEGQLSTDADERGCFVLRSVPRGLAQLIVRTSADQATQQGKSVVTPSFVV